MAPVALPLGDEDLLLARHQACAFEVDELLNFILPLEEVQKQLKPVPRKGTLPIAQTSGALFEVLFRAFLGQSGRLLDSPTWGAALRRLLAPGAFSISGTPPTVTFDPQLLAGFHATASPVLGAQVAQQVATEVTTALTNLYLAARDATSKQLRAPQDPFTLTEVRALQVLSQDTLFWVRDAYSSRLTGTINRVLGQTVLEGLDPRAAAESLKAQLGQRFQETDAYWYIVAQAGMGRAANYGRVNRFREFEIETYEFVSVIDSVTSEICLHMNGRVFQVQKAAQLVDSVVGAGTPGEVRTKHRWLNFDRGRAERGQNSLWFRDTPDGLPPEDPAQDPATRSYLPDSKFGLKGDRWEPKGNPGNKAVNLRLEQLGTILPPLHARCRSDVVASERAVQDYLQAPPPPAAPPPVAPAPSVLPPAVVPPSDPRRFAAEGALGLDYFRQATAANPSLPPVEVARLMSQGFRERGDLLVDDLLARVPSDALALELAGRLEQIVRTRLGPDWFKRRGRYTEGMRSKARKVTTPEDVREFEAGVGRAFDLFGPLAERAQSQVRSLRRSKKRSSYDDSTLGLIWGDWTLLAHEVGHSIETGTIRKGASSRALKTTESFWRQYLESRRGPGEKNRPLGPPFSKNEVHLRDVWPGDPYMMRVYPDGKTEVVSLMTELLVQRHPAAIRAIARDPDFLRVFVGWLDAVTAGAV